MKKRIIIILCALVITMLQLPYASEADSGLEGMVSEQSETITASGNGFFYEAEKATYCNSYTLVNNSLASDGMGLKANKEDKSGASSSDRGKIELTFTAKDSGTYVAWGRLYAQNSGQDSLYAAFAGQSYTVVNFGDNYGEFAWIKLGSKYLNTGDEATLRIINREKNAIVDAFIITPTSYVPSGLTGNLPKDEIENTLTSFYAPTPVKPPNEHPRVLFTEADVQRIKANMEKDENQYAVNKLNSLLRYTTSGNSGGKYNLTMLGKIEAFAFDYAINGNVQSGNVAVSAIINYLDRIEAEGYTSNYTREGGTTIYFASKVYDWCYDLLTQEQKKKIIAKCEMLAHEMEIGWPPNDQGSLVGHGAEAQLLRDMLSFAIAVYDERPDIWEAVGGRFYEEYVPGRNYFNQSGWHNQGDSYGLYRHRWDAWSYFLITGMGHPSPYNDAELSQMGYGHIYMRRPDGQYLRDGDSYLDTTYSMWEYWQNDTHTYLMDSVIGDDPYLKDEAFSQNITNSRLYEDSPVMFLIINNPDLKSASVKNLPKSRFFSDPSGMMVARTGWDKGAASDDVVVQMKIGGIQVNNHQHFDAGHFQIYYKGILASDSGVYQGLDNSTALGGTTYGSKHYNMYMTKTIAHNSMLVYDPDESNGEGNRREVNDGGQRAAGGGNEPWSIKNILNEQDYYRTGMVEGREIDPKNPITPEYTYIKGDLTKAYSSKVSDFKRSFMFLNLFDEKVPGVLIVFDKVTSSDASFKKTWLLHGVEKPWVKGNQTIFSRTYQSPVTPSEYNGKMTVDTMLPKSDDTVINIVGGEEDGYSNVNGVDYTGYPAISKVDEGNTYRMELSPKSARKTDYFLNVIQVSDNDKDYYYKPQMLENEMFYGVQIKDRAVFFSKSGNRIGDNITLELPTDLLKVTLCDMKKGKWSVTQNGKTINVFATEEGGILSFEASGSISVRYISGENVSIVSEIVLKKENPVNVRIAGQYVHCKVEPELVNGKAVLPLSTISEWFKINRIDNGGKITLTNKYATVSVEWGSSLLTIGDTTTDMGVTVFEKDGEIMVPASDVVEAFGGNSEWRKYYNLIDIELPVQDYSLSESYAKVKNVINDGGEIDGDNVPENAVDGNGDTIWAALGQGRYIDIELDGFYTIDKAEILFNPNGNRTAKFKIQISDDGVHYTTVLSDVSDGALEAVVWEKYDFDAPVTAKYIRYIANGSNISEWNAIKEIRFREYRQSEETLEAEVDSEGKISAKAFVCNEGRYPKKCIVAVAQYSEDGRLIKVDLSEQHTVAPRIDYPYEFKVVTEKMSCAESVKAFLWDEIASAKPYKAMVVY